MEKNFTLDDDSSVFEKPEKIPKMRNKVKIKMMKRRFVEFRVWSRRKKRKELNFPTLL